MSCAASNEQAHEYASPACGEKEAIITSTILVTGVRGMLLLEACYDLAWCQSSGGPRWLYLDVHAVFFLELLPRRRDCGDTTGKIRHLLLWYAIQVDSIPVSRHRVRDVLSVPIVCTSAKMWRYGEPLLKEAGD